jgi:tetratricopeptide (TPR) repeat protein
VLLRSLLVLQYQGLFYTEEASRIVDEAQDLTKRSGDLRLRFSVESNLAVAHLDAGDLDRAEVLMLRSSQMLGSAELDLNRFNQAYNSGELALAQRQYDEARRHFNMASDYIGQRTPVYAADLVNAGVGLCAIETGDLQEAKAREDALTSFPTRWYVDPTSLVAFSSRMREMRREYSLARGLLDQAADDVQDRLVLAWLKIRLLQARLERKFNPRRGETLAREGWICSRELGLTHRMAEFERLLLRLGRST